MVYDYHMNIFFATTSSRARLVMNKTFINHFQCYFRLLLLYTAPAANIMDCWPKNMWILLCVLVVSLFVFSIFFFFFIEIYLYISYFIDIKLLYPTGWFFLDSATVMLRIEFYHTLHSHCRKVNEVRPYQLYSTSLTLAICKKNHTIYKVCVMWYKCLKTMAPAYIKESQSVCTCRQMRSSSDQTTLIVPNRNLKPFGFQSFHHLHPRLWNNCLETN